MISTHRRLNAFKIKWSSNISFGHIFHNCILNFGGNVDGIANMMMDAAQNHYKRKTKKLLNKI